MEATSYELRVTSDVYADVSGVEVFESEHIDAPNVRGTGCMLASAIATGLAQGLSMREAIMAGRGCVREVIASFSYK